MPRLEDWFAGRTFRHRSFTDLETLRARKEEQGLTISAAIPTLNEAATIETIVRTIREELVEGVPLVDELVVMDSRSDDGTPELAREAGAVVHQDREVLPEMPPLGGKGEALWKSLFVTSGDVIVWLDADIENFHPRFVYGLLGPLLTDPEVHFVKAFYERPLQRPEGLEPSGGGRVTELVARPLLNMFWPELGGLIQPLSGEYAGRRSVLEQVPFATGYGVEIGLVIDLYERHGLACMAQVDLETRIHRNRDLKELSRMASAILQSVLARLEAGGKAELRSPAAQTLRQFERVGDSHRMEAIEVEIHERPPAASVPGYPRSGDP